MPGPHLDTLLLMVAVHAAQACIGLLRAVKAALAGRLKKPTVDALLASGAGPTAGGLLLGAMSYGAL